MRCRLPPLASIVMVAVTVALAAAPGVAHASAAEVGDPSSTRRAYLIAAAMAAVGVVLLMITVWFWRTTRPEHRALGPLEVMSERKWRNADPIARMRFLDDARPEGAHAMGRIGRIGRGVSSPAIDLKANARDLRAGFEDLADHTPDRPLAPNGAHRPALSQARADELEQLLSGLGIDPMPFVHDHHGGDVAGPEDETRAESRPVVLDPLLHRSES